MPSQPNRPYDIERYFAELEEILSLESKQADLARHSLGQGHNREEIVRRFLKSHLPKRFTITKGEIRDRHNNRSREFDVLISDRLHNPQLYRLGNHEVMPVETVYAIVEVKKRLTEKEFNRASESMFELQGLDYGLRQVTEMDPRGRTETWSFNRLPWFLVAFEGPEEWTTAITWFEDWYKTNELTRAEIGAVAPQCVCLLGEYALLLGVSETDMRPGYVRSPPDGTPLLTLYLILLQVLENISLSGFQILDYEDIKRYFDRFVTTESIEGERDSRG